MKKQSFYTQLDNDNKYILLCCFFVFAVNGLYSMILGSMLPLIIDEYSINDTIGGALISAHQAGNLIAGFIAGILPVYLGRKRTVMSLSTFVIIGFILMIITGNPVLLIVSFFFTGLSRGSISNFNNAVVNEVSNGSTPALSFLHSIFAVGALMGPFLIILCTKFAGDNGWKTAAIFISILAVISIFLFSQMKIKEISKEQKKEKLSYDFLKMKKFWCNAGILFFYLCVEATVIGWIVKYFVDINIMTTEYAQTLASLLWVFILAGRLTIVFTGGKISKKIILLSTSLGTALFYILLLSTQNITVITIAIMGLGFSMAGIYPTTISNLGTIINTYPVSMSVLLVSGGIGGIIMPVITGRISDMLGIFAGMSAVVIAIILLLVFVSLELTSKKEDLL